MKSILIPIADGSEEIEAISLIDVLRRAGFKVTMASVGQLTVKGAHQINLVADKLLKDCQDNYDGIFLPGGMPGATNLANSELLISMLQKQAQAGKFYGAICASPAVVLAAHGLLEGKEATCYPGFESKLPNYQADKVVVDKNCITAQSPGSAQEFALRIIAVLDSDQASQKIRQDLC
jgi:4-methyl-5(b-hydroxyethyl)-thiazole monophosphate biosynthesis